MGKGKDMPQKRTLLFTLYVTAGFSVLGLSLIGLYQIGTRVLGDSLETALRSVLATAFISIPAMIAGYQILYRRHNRSPLPTFRPVKGVRTGFVGPLLQFSALAVVDGTAVLYAVHFFVRGKSTVIGVLLAAIAVAASITMVPVLKKLYYRLFS